MRINKRIDKYLLEEEIGRGNFAIVYKASYEEEGIKTYYAVKCICKQAILSTPVLKKLLHSEISVMKYINHPNVMHLFEFFETKNNYYLVINYCHDGDLESYMRINKIKFFKEKEALKSLKQIMNGFVELRKFNVIHRDIKLSNIFLDGERVIIGDFGSAKTGKEMTGTKLGTPVSMAPEMLSGNGVYSSKSDLWSIGVTFYQLLYGTQPFFALSHSELLAEICGNSGENLKIPDFNKISPATKDLLRKLLEEDPQKRISWELFFSHPAFESCKKDYSFSQKAEENHSEPDVKEKLKIELLPANGFLFKNGSEHIYSNHIPQVVPRIIEPTAQNPNKYASAIIIDEIIKMLQPMDQHQENFFRYSHELNKLQFLLKTGKTSIITALKGGLPSPVRLFCFRSGIFLFLKYEIINKELKTSLVKRDNRLGLYYFQQFTSSYHFELVIDMLDEIGISASKIRKELQKSSIFNDLLKVNGDSNCFNVVLPVEKIQKELKDFVFIFYKSFLKNQDSIISLSVDLIFLTVFIFLGIKLDEMFPYWIETKKFNWNTFVKNYENMNKGKLLDIFHYLAEELLPR